MPAAIVTGASRGLGLALSRALLLRGWRVVIDARDAEALDRAAAELRRAGDVVALRGDVLRPDHRRALVEAAGPRVDLLVNNASTLGPTFAVNVLAPLALVQLVLPRMPAGGCVVNVTSDAAIEAYPGWGGYGASKSALEQVTAVLAAEHPELRIMAVDPGDMRTQMHQDAFPGEDISDRPPPEAAVPGFLAAIEDGTPSGLYRARDLVPVAA